MTPRQRQILALFASGMTRREVAVHLGVSEWTVKRHMAEAYERLGVQTATPRGHSMLEAFRVMGWLRAPKLRCVLFGHAVAWGPCDRCHRRALG